MSDHTNKQFDAEMEAIRTGVLTMGGLVEKQLTRAIGALENGRPRGPDRRGRRRRARRSTRCRSHIDQQCAQIIARRQPAAIDLRMVLTIDQDRQRPRAHRRRDQEDRLQGGQRRERPARARALSTTWCARPASRSACCSMALDAFARLDVDAAAEIDRPRRRDRRRVRRDPAPADQLHDGGPAHDQPRSRSCSWRSRSSASATTRRTSPRPSCRSSRATTCATRSAAADPRGGRRERSDADDPRRRGRAGDPRAAEGQPRRRRLRRRGRLDAEAAQGADPARAARPRAARLDAARAVRPRACASSCAPTRARASCRSSWSRRAATKPTASPDSRPGSTTT